MRRRYSRLEKAVGDDCSLFFTIYVSGRLFFQEENRNIVLTLSELKIYLNSFSCPLKLKLLGNLNLLSVSFVI